MTNKQRRAIVDEAKSKGYTGSYIDLFKQAMLNPSENEEVLMAGTEQEKKDGLRPYHEAGRTDASMSFPDVPPNTPFNTVGMKAPIDIKKYDEQGHLVKSYENVPPGLTNIDSGPARGMVLETPARMQRGGYNPGEYMNEMQPKVFPNQKRDAQWVNYTTEHDFAGRFPGETKSNRELGLEISNRNTVPLPPTPTVPKELRTRAQEGTFASDNTRVSMPELQDQEAFNPYSDLHLPPSGRIDYSPVNVEDLLGIGQLIKPSRAVKRYFQKAADEGRNAGIAFRNAQAQKEAVIRNEKIAQRIDQGIDIGYDDIYKPIRAEFQQKLDMGYTNIRANPYGEISRSLQNRFAPLSRGPVNDFKKDINRFLDYHIPSQYRAEQRLFNRKLQRKADDALDEMIKFDRGSRTYLDQIENLYKPSKGGSKSTGSISGPSAKEKLADDFFDRNLDAPGTVQNKRGGYIKLRRKRYK